MNTLTEEQLTPKREKTINDLLSEQREALAKNLAELEKQRTELDTRIKETKRILKAYNPPPSPPPSATTADSQVRTGKP